jgi:hypothetical protein
VQLVQFVKSFEAQELGKSKASIRPIVRIADYLIVTDANRLVQNETISIDLVSSWIEISIENLKHD